MIIPIKILSIIFLTFVSSTVFGQLKPKLALEGLVPGQYLAKDKNSYVQALVVIDRDTRLIEGLYSVDENQALIESIKLDANIQYLPLKKKDIWDVMYPGLIDLHNHTKQNNLGVWADAKGQFANRFEWRAWSRYTKAVSGNMNPWIGYGSAINCAAFRWSEIQALAVGTTYLQGPSHCVENFGIHRVEDRGAYVSNKLNVQAPTDLVIPGDMVFVWNTLGPIIRQIQKENESNPNSEAYRLAYEEALAQVINQYCDFSSKGIVIDKHTVRDQALPHLKNKALLSTVCSQELPPKFIRYIYWVHKSVMGKKLYSESIANGEGSAIIAHLAEGRRDDIYNNREFDLVQLLGMDNKHVNFVHGVGIDEDGLTVMGQKQMGLIWSPYSNLLLYNQTLDIKLALEKDVLLALGSDWLPTGSKGPLEELKLARNYILKNNLQGALESSLETSAGKPQFDEALYKMVTENPAKMINHWQSGADLSNWQNGEEQGGVGTLAKGAMGTLIVTSKLDENPYTNLVAKVWESDIQLVVIDGHIQYGGVSYLQGLEYEELPNLEHDMENLQLQNIPFLEGSPIKEEKQAFLVELGKIVTNHLEVVKNNASTCTFDEPKGFVSQSTMMIEKDLLVFKNQSGLNLDRFADIQRLIGINLMTQSRNRNDPEKGDPEFQVTDFTPLYTCNDANHYERLTGFVSPIPGNQEDELYINNKLREQKIMDQKLGNGPIRMAEKYPLPY